MQAIMVHQLGGPEQLVWQAVADLQPTPHQVRLQTLLTGVNYADVMSRRGGYDAGSTPPFIPGLDAVGQIEAVGTQITGLEVGQRVVAFTAGGSYSEQCLATPDLVYPLPPALSNESVGGLTVLVTAYNLLAWAARLTPGETVVVHSAAGGVGSTLVQLARLLGADKIIAVVGTAEKARWVERLQPDLIINRETADWATAVRREVGGDGVQVILDSSAGPQLEQGMELLAPFGRMVVYGHASGQPAQITTPALHRHNKAVIGYSSGHYRRARPQALRSSVEAVLGYLLRGELELQIAARFPLAQAAQAHRLVESGASMGKVLLMVG